MISGDDYVIMMKFGLNFIGKGYNLHVNKMMDFPFYSF